MTQSHDTDPQADSADLPKPFWRSSAGRWTLISLVIAAAVFGWEYRAAILSSAAIVWLPLVLCAGMHFFMHRGHGSHHGRHDDER